MCIHGNWLHNGGNSSMLLWFPNECLLKLADSTSKKYKFGNDQLDYCFLLESSRDPQGHRLHELPPFTSPLVVVCSVLGSSILEESREPCALARTRATAALSSKCAISASFNRSSNSAFSFPFFCSRKSSVVASFRGTSSAIPVVWDFILLFLERIKVKEERMGCVWGGKK